MKRTMIGESAKCSGKEVTIKGWVHTRRDHGKIVFLDVRDISGLIQVVVVPGSSAYDKITPIRPEWVVSITGNIKNRPDSMVNKALSTGTVEMEAKDIEILNEAKTPPFEVDKDTIKIDEELRLKHRYLDIRSTRMQNNIQMRHKIIYFMRQHLSELGFTEIQTPILSKSTPEGARDYLVPSRLHQGKFFALPQSPQQYKQLLMVGGLEKYFQIAPCFRDEDARADRSPGEFYQLDIEMSFVTQEDVLNMTEKLFTDLVKELYPKKHITSTPWPRLSHKEAMEKYKTDKPDLRKDKNDPNELAFAWILDFPLFTKQTKEDHFHGAGKTMAPSHHMFTAPKEEDIKLLDSDPKNVKSYQHDMVINGFETGGGSIRIHDPKIQDKVFDLIGFSKEDKKKFNHLLESFEYGVPPHGGIAHGIERIVMILQNEKNLREVTPFPLTGDGRDPLLGSPSTINYDQLNDVGLELKNEQSSHK